MSFQLVSRGTGDLKTRYRPMCLSEMVPTVHINKLYTIYTDPNAGQVHLFEGPSGTGKTTAARIVARAAVCVTHPPDIERPCLECSNCVSMNDSSPDFVEINVANFRGIDAIRSIIDSMRYSPVQLNHKIYIFDEVHQLTQDSQQLLLKELEEPAEKMLVFLCTTQMKGLKKTLVDRAITTPFHGVTREAAQDIIHQVLKLEGKEGIDGDTRLRIIEKAEGSVRAVLNNLQSALGGTTDFGSWAGDVPSEVPELANALMRKDWPNVARLLRADGISKAGESTRIGLENYLRAVVLNKETITGTTKAAVPLGHMEGTLANEPKISQYNQLVLRCLRACWAR